MPYQPTSFIPCTFTFPTQQTTNTSILHTSGPTRNFRSNFLKHLTLIIKMLGKREKFQGRLFFSLNNSIDVV